LSNCRAVFLSTMSFIADVFGRAAFRPEGILNVSIFEAVSVEIAKIMNSSLPVALDLLKANHSKLFSDTKFMNSVTKGTSDEPVFKERHRLVHEIFHSL